MSQKLALVVDDSESARQVLRRMLEKHNISVDTASSANEALDYLSRHRPDVIFMDHNMPGMDGFEAIKQIKANPATVTIPVMMYTSKEGDLYLGEARALGAVGILPKTVAPAELFGALVRLGLTKNRRTNLADDENTGGPSERAADVAEVGARGWALVDEAIPVRTHENMSKEDEHLRFLLDEQRVELRKDMLIAIDSVSKNISKKHNVQIQEVVKQVQDERPDDHSRWFKFAAIGSGLLLLWSLNGISNLKTQLAELKSSMNNKPAIATLAKAKAVKQKAVKKSSLETTQEETVEQSVWNSTQHEINKYLSYPFDELALEKERTLKIETLVDQLKADGFTGTVTLETHVGDFCLSGNGSQGFVLAESSTPLNDCDYIGNPVQPTDLPATQQSLQFANFLSSLDLEDRFTIDIVSLPRTTALTPYPVQDSETTAGQWNRAATENNRVLIHLQSE